MKKHIFLCSSLCMMLAPAIGMTSVSLSPYSLNYTGTVKGHNATVSKNLTIANGTCTTTSQIIINAFFNKTINQTATATCNGSTVSSLTFGTDVTGSMVTQNVPANVYDTLNLPNFLSAALINNNNTISPTTLSVLQNGNVVSVLCNIVNANTSIVTAVANQTVPAISILCASSDNTTQLTYSFSTDGKATVLSMGDSNNNTQETINQYP